MKPYVPPENSAEAARVLAAGYRCPRCGARPVIGRRVRVEHADGCPRGAAMRRGRTAA